ncbi:MAG: MFS transporter, partial [Anaerolineae bacterium]|nr:MFS transporter [Anaerolineae bacterium]
MFRSRAYWMVAGLYMLSFGATALVEPYLVQHLLRLGLNGAQVGNLMAVVNMVGLVFIPLASSHADRSGRPRRAANASMLFQGISSAGMALLAQPFLIAAAVIPYRYFSTLGMTIRNRLALHWLEQRQSQDFGSLRLWGSIGFSVCALLGGLIAERLGVPFLFLLSGGLILCAILLMGTFAQQLPVSPPRKRRGRMPPALVLILLVTGMMALSRTAYTGWANDFIETGLGGGQSAVGAFGAIAALVEVPVMIYEYRLIRRWGASAMWVLGLILLAVTFWLFSGVQTVAQALMMAVLIGISQG